MPTQVNEQTVDGVNLNNTKSAADMAIAAFNVATQNAVANQQSVQAIQNAALQGHLAMQQALTARASRFILDVSAEQAAGFAHELSANLSSQLSDIGGSLAHLQEDAKIAQTTPPQTGTGGAFGSDSGSALLQQLGNIQALLQSLSERIK